MSPLTIRKERAGIHLPELGLWLDAKEPVTNGEKVFVSHAHADHIAAHHEVICSRVTASLMANRLKSNNPKVHALDFDAVQTCHHASAGFRITLFPAGHIFGSAMAYIEADGESLLYTGDFKLRPGKSAEACCPHPADYLIMETTYGRAGYQFPPTHDVVQGIIRFCREALDNGETPLLLGYSLGKSQELLHPLGDAGFALALHPQAHSLTQIYEQLGQSFPPYEAFDPAQSKGRVLIFPPAANRTKLPQELGPVRTAALTGWAIDPSCRFRHQVDAAFPLSDHADFPDLLELVRQVHPKCVYTIHGFASDFAETLRKLGYEAQAMDAATEQLDLPLQVPQSHTSTAKVDRFTNPNPPETIENASPERPPPASTAESLSASPASFLAFSKVCEQIRAHSGKHDKVSLIAEYLQSVPEAVLRQVTTWLSGYPFPPHQHKPLQVGGAQIRDTICQCLQLTTLQFHQTYLKHSDLGETVFDLFSNRPPSANPPALNEVAELLETLYQAKGQHAKRNTLRQMLTRTSAMEAKYLVKILSGELRIGLREGLLEEGVAQAFAIELDEIKRATMLTGDLAEIALAARKGELAGLGLVPFRPFKFMLASAEPTAAAIWERVRTDSRKRKSGDSTTSEEPSQTWVEDKYDGIRCQLHKKGDTIRLYSRDLREVTPTFYEIVEGARDWSEDAILDGELVAMKGEQALPFAELQKRLGRQADDLFLQEEIPVRFVAFDLLWHNGRTLLKEPFDTRRRHLAGLALPKGCRLAEGRFVSSAEAIETAFDAARERGNEGLVVKTPQSRYTPGRRGLAWLKLKKAYARLDCVVIGAEYGHGKRRNLLSDYTFAVLDDSTHELKTIGKAYSGLTDQEIADLTRHFLHHTKRRNGRYHEVEPDTVLEIAFDSIRTSNRHTSGLAMRFPRIERIRSDKSVREIDTLTTARTLAAPAKRSTRRRKSG